MGPSLPFIYPSGVRLEFLTFSAPRQGRGALFLFERYGHNTSLKDDYFQPINLLEHLEWAFRSLMLLRF